MDLSVILIALVFVAVFTIPFIYLQRMGDIKKKKFNKAFEALVQKHQLTVSESEFWDHMYAMGVDKNSGKLLYVVKNNGQFEDTIIHLNEVENCNRSDGSKILKTTDPVSRNPERLSLVFSYKGQKYPDKKVDFYVESLNSAITDEVNIMSKWHRIVTGIIKG